MDINGDGILSFEEFVQMTKKILKEKWFFIGIIFKKWKISMLIF
jgi:hypothetical protein